MPQYNPENSQHHTTSEGRSNNTFGRTLVIRIQWLIWLLSRYWLIAANLLSGAVLALAFLAPALMAEGLVTEGQAVYRFLAPHNHQLPQRSYFLFGKSGGINTYSTEQVVAWGADPQRLQSFVGNPEIGFKTALNHRMVAIFGAIFFGGVLWGLAGGRPRLNLVLFLLLTIPILLDGFSHMLSERSGLGFRENNAWAMVLSGDAFPLDVYQGTTIGTLNWLLRTLTGFLFGLGLVWFLNTYLSNRFALVRARLESKFGSRRAIK